MPTFRYTAKDENAHTVTGKITAENQANVVAELRKRNLIIIKIENVKEAAGARTSFGSRKVKPDDIVIFSRQLSTMIDAGIPIVQALESLQDQLPEGTLKKIIATIKDDIQLGNSMSVAFSKHPKAFDRLYVNMIKVGEKGGVLSAVLDRVSTYMEKTLQLRRKVKSALVYPAVVISMAMIITVVLLVKVVPTFAQIYDSFDQELPAMTQMLLDISDFARAHLLKVIAAIILGVFFMKKWYQTDKGALLLDRLKLKIPIIGPLLHKVALSRFSRTLATLTQSGVAILEALDIVGESSGNKVLELVVVKVKDNIREGESISGPLTKSGVFPPMVTRMIAIGEQTGQLEKMLGKIAEFYDDQVDAAVSGLTSIIEPVLIGFLGIVVGFIVLALFLPISNVTQMLQV